MGIAATSVATELAFHVLAHVPMAGPGTTFDPRYLDWLAAQGDEPAGDRARAIADGELLARTLAVAPACELVHRLPELHADAALEAACRRALAELHADDVADAATLAAMQRAGGVAFELCHAMLGLALASHRRRFAEHVAPALAGASTALEQLCRQSGPLAEALLEHRIELAWALGPRGRAFDRRIVVGSPAPWHEGELATSAVIALHEHFVRDRSVGDGWADREWAALVGLAQAIPAGAPPLAAAHARWLAALDLRSLVGELAARGVVTPTRAARLVAAPDERAELLRGG